MAAQFVNIVLPTAAPMRALTAPSEMDCSTEEVVEDGRLDLRFRAEGWDVIIELKIYASYGQNQLDRYLSVLDRVHDAYVTAITRAVPRYGEPRHGVDERWLGSVQWRHLLPGLRAMRGRDPALNEQWPLFFDVLEEEGSMGFTKPQPDLFRLFGELRAVMKHTDEFVEALQMPLLEALVDALGGGEGAADIHRGRGGRMHIARSRNAITDIIFRVPASGAQRIRAGLFAYNPPVRFYVAPMSGRTWVARMARLSPSAQEAVRYLISRGFRDRDLHSFFELDEQTLRSPTLEENVVEWTHARFVDIVESGLLECTTEPFGLSTQDEELSG
jgi:hypothetical protein